MNRAQKERDVDESSGVTSLRPVPVEPARLPELSEGESTQYFSASELLSRGKALSARSSESVSSAIQQPAPATVPPREGWPVQFRRASPVRKAIAISLPLLCVLLLAKPRFEIPKLPGRPSAPVSPPIASALPKAPPANASASANANASVESPPTLPRGMTLVRAAADSVATGDFSRAASLYRELSRRQPNSQVFHEAARILSERAKTPTP